MRLAHVDEGEGPPILMLHGEPTWGFLWRKVMGPLLRAGFRCVVPDLPGFGRSDKPVDEAWYSYRRHTEAVASLLDDLDLSDVTLVGQDWGGPIGLRLATIEPVRERISRLVLMDTGVFTGTQRMNDQWLRFLGFVERNHDLPIGRLIAGGVVSPLSDEVIAAYEAPFPTPESKAGARAFPKLVPLEPGAPGAAEGRQVLEALSHERRPVLLLWADSDPVLPMDPVGRSFAGLFPSSPEIVVISGAGHFLQEDRGDQIGQRIASWLDD